MTVPLQPHAQIEALAQTPSFEAENCPGIRDMSTRCEPGSDFQQTSYPTPEASQSRFQASGPVELSVLCASQDFQPSQYGNFDHTCDPPMAFRDRHRFLDGIYNSYPDPDWITARDMQNIAQKVGLLMDEVTSWFADEKARRVVLLALDQHQKQTMGCQFPPSPESTRASCEVSSTSSSYNTASPETPSQSLDVCSPCPASTTDEKMLAPPKPKRGRPAKTQIKTEPDLPDTKRKKPPVKYPCPDCGNFVAAERFAEHIDRKHFPENVWECPKTNRRTGKHCSSNHHYRPSYRQDNFATHLKGEHDCPDAEVVELKKTCKFEVTDFFHKICGFCDKSLGSRDESIEHIKDHLRETSMQPNPPIDLGISLWKERCGSEHRLQLGVHYRRNQHSTPDPMDEDHEDANDGSGEGNSNNSGQHSPNAGQDNNNHLHDHDDGDVPRDEGTSDHQGHDSFAPFESDNISQSQDDESGHNSSSTECELGPVPDTMARTRQPRKLTTKEDANFVCQVQGCGRLFGRSYNFKTHMETHDAGQAYPFPCPVEGCIKKFMRKTDLQSHRHRNHLKRRNYHCDSCSRLFAQQDELRSHVKDGCSKSSDIKASSPVSISEHTYQIPSSPMGTYNEEVNFPLYPNPPHVFLQPFNFSATYAEAPHIESPGLGGDPSKYCTAPAPSASSSAMGSPHSIHDNVLAVPEWSTHGLGLDHSIVGYDSFGNREYTFQPTGMDDFTLNFSLLAPNKPPLVDPTLIHPLSSSVKSSDLAAFPPPQYPASPAVSRSPRPVKQGNQSPYPSSYGSSYPYPPPYRPFLASHQSFSSEEAKEKGRCTYSECGKLFKDLKAHILTHQNERPEKCPIKTCDYHVKGFSRKYDKNRHTLTHYKGTMVCGFCPGSGSAAEKSFNRADVFKRHLTSVHAVEQTPPNSRKKTSGNINSTKKLSSYAPDATGKCSTCSGTFSNAQDFYEHLDDCVLRIIQQEEPSEAINATRLTEVEQDQDLHETVHNNDLPATITNVYSVDEDEDDEELDDENDNDFTLRSESSRKGRGSRNPTNGAQKSRGLTHSKGGVTLNTKGRKKRKDYPSSLGCPTSQMKTKKRVLCVFDGPRRHWKDDMMLDTDYEVRMKLSDRKAYVTDLDVQSMRRADAFHNSTEEEKQKRYITDLDVQTFRRTAAFEQAIHDKGATTHDEGANPFSKEVRELAGSVSPSLGLNEKSNSMGEWILINDAGKEEAADALMILGSQGIPL